MAEQINLKTSDPMTIFKAAAEGMGIYLNDPDSNCKKCHGTGCLGRYASTGEPIPCKCIFPKESRNIGDVPMNCQPRNRAERRALKKG